MGTPQGQRARILILHSIKMRSVAIAALALALAVGGASAQVMEGMPGGYEECPTPYKLGTEYNDIGYIIANTYDHAEQMPKSRRPGLTMARMGQSTPTLSTRRTS